MIGRLEGYIKQSNIIPIKIPETKIETPNKEKIKPSIEKNPNQNKKIADDFFKISQNQIEAIIKPKDNKYIEPSIIPKQIKESSTDINNIISKQKIYRNDKYKSTSTYISDIDYEEKLEKQSKKLEKQSKKLEKQSKKLEKQSKKLEKQSKKLENPKMVENDKSLLNFKIKPNFDEEDLNNLVIRNDIDKIKSEAKNINAESKKKKTKKIVKLNDLEIDIYKNKLKELALRIKEDKAKLKEAVLVLKEEKQKFKEEKQKLKEG